MNILNIGTFQIKLNFESKNIQEKLDALLVYSNMMDFKIAKSVKPKTRVAANGKEVILSPKVEMLIWNKEKDCMFTFYLSNEEDMEVADITVIMDGNQPNVLIKHCGNENELLEVIEKVSIFL